jgi:hypothetical protein
MQRTETRAQRRSEVQLTQLFLIPWESIEAAAADLFCLEQQSGKRDYCVFIELCSLEGVPPA